MRLVFQFPANITSVVEAPRLVSSDASLTRPESAVTRLLDASGLDGRRKPQPDHLRRQWHHAVARLRTRGRAQRPESARHAVLHEPHVVHLALLVRLAPADGDEEPVAVGRIDAVGPAQGAHFAAPHPRHEQQFRDHRIKTPALGGDMVGLDTAPAPPRPVAGGEHGRQV